MYYITYRIGQKFGGRKVWRNSRKYLFGEKKFGELAAANS